MLYAFFENVKLSYINYEGRKIYKDLTGGCSSIGNLCSVLFSTIENKVLFEINNNTCIVEMLPISGFLNKKTGLLPFAKSVSYRYGQRIEFLKNENDNICYYNDSKLNGDDCKPDNYLKCDFFCRKDFPFNGILFSSVNIDNIDGKKETIYYCRNLETGEIKEVKVSNSLIYL